MREKHSFPFGTVFFIVLAIISCKAFGEEPLLGTLRTMDPRPLGMGGAVRASPGGTSGIYLNPAVLSMVPLYHIEGMYQYTGQEEMHGGGGAVVDSVTTVVGAGFSFNYSRIDQSRADHEAYDFRLALSAGFADLFYIGATGRYLHLKQAWNKKKWGPGGAAALPSSGSQQVDGFTFDAGAALRLGKIVSIGVVGYNLTNTGSVFAPIELGTGISLSLVEMLLIEGDVVLDFTSQESVNTELEVGAELFVAGTVGIRAGYDYDVFFDIHSIAAGLGYVHPKFGIDAGFMHEIKEDGRMQLGFAFKYFVN